VRFEYESLLAGQVAEEIFVQELSEIAASHLWPFATGKRPISATFLNHLSKTAFAHSFDAGSPLSVTPKIVSAPALAVTALASGIR
jgi:hypothetical protein